MATFVHNSTLDGTVLPAECQVRTTELPKGNQRGGSANFSRHKIAAWAAVFGKLAGTRGFGVALLSTASASNGQELRSLYLSKYRVFDILFDLVQLQVSRNRCASSTCEF